MQELIKKIIKISKKKHWFEEFSAFGFYKGYYSDMEFNGFGRLLYPNKDSFSGYWNSI